MDNRVTIGKAEGRIEGDAANYSYSRDGPFGCKGPGPRGENVVLDNDPGEAGVPGTPSDLNIVSTSGRNVRSRVDVAFVETFDRKRDCPLYPITRIHPEPTGLRNESLQYSRSGSDFRSGISTHHGKEWTVRSPPSGVFLSSLDRRRMGGQWTVDTEKSYL